MSTQSHKSPKSPVAPSVVVVSEDAIQCHLLVSLLKHHKKNVWEARSVEHALRLLGELRSVDVIVIDWDMPGESGPRFSQSLHRQSYQAGRHIPILAVSSQSACTETRDPSQIGVDAIVALPINPTRFLGSIDTLLKDNRLAKYSPRVLIASPTVSQGDSLCWNLQEMGWIAHVTTTGKETRQLLKELCPDLVLLHQPISEEIGLELVVDIKVRHPEVAVFLATESDDSSWAVKALQHGVDEVIRSPLSGQYVHVLWEKYRKFHDMPLGTREESEISTARAVHDQTSMTRLAGEMAHDINNVLTSILGHAGMLNQRPLVKNSVLRSAQVIELAARRGKELTAKLLGSVRPQPERRESVNLCDIVKEVLDLVQPEVNQAIRVLQRFQASDNWVKGDPIKLHQIVLNLIMNACDAMSQGGTLIVESQMTVVEARGSAPQKPVVPGRYLELIVRDTGRGIPEDVLPHIFEVFFTTKSQGSGIGLATVRDVVTQCGGAVTVESRHMCGTAFHVFLPQMQGERRKGELNGTNHHKGHVLVVDDDPSVGQTAAEILEFLGHQVTVIDNGQTAIDLVRSQNDPIDLVLLDMSMAPMDGLTCFRALRMHNPEIPVIISSGFEKNYEVQQLLDDGLAGFVQKPYDVRELILMLSQVYGPSCDEPPTTVSIPASVAEEIV